ncbi:uncharacterized protein N0V89_008275 [Didymosphaeria variabile]|uniref:Uncharacterized protein n=1 Tax=Didymosphaeria variabile TaxID=1932322 RepID=A0A9W9C8P2_9PLEO|nr:uncharacterized protein N0V89_008275 [Didymosphaeria variabile]KAJ4349658.1 hypothetical protein N0V89_008275 [Didymosphaeria variabile]
MEPSTAFNEILAISSIHANWHLPSSIPSIGLIPPLCPPTDRYFPEAWPIPLLKSLLRLSELTVGEKDRAIWYLKTTFSARIDGDPQVKKLGVQVVDVEAAVAGLEYMSRPEVGGKVDSNDEGHEEYQETLGNQKSMAGKSKSSAENKTGGGSIREINEQEEPSYKRRRTECNSDQVAKPDKSRASKPQWLQHESLDAEPEVGTVDRGTLPESPEAITKIKSVTNESESTYRRQKEEQDKEIFYTGAERDHAQHVPMQAVNIEALTPQTLSREVARTKSSSIELEAAYARAIEERRKVGEKTYKKLVVDVQAARKPQSAPPPVPQHPHPPRESAEVMLRKLELEEAEAKLRASIQQERLRAEVVARRKAVAQALMMEEQGLR